VVPSLIILCSNAFKSKMELLENYHKIFAVERLVFEKIDQFKYLGATIRSNNDCSVEIVNRIQKAKKAYCAFFKVFQIQIILEKDEIETVYCCI